MLARSSFAFAPVCASASSPDSPEFDTVAAHLAQPPGTPVLPGFERTGAYGVDALRTGTLGVPAEATGNVDVIRPSHPRSWLPLLDDNPELFSELRAQASKWRIGERVIDLAERPLVMGIINTTPDSFSDGGNFLDSERAIRHGRALVAGGAEILDVGGESTRPGADPVRPDDEAARVIPVIRALRAETDALISVDTRRASVARVALAAGADIVNDVSAFRDDSEMAEVVARSACGIVLMHKRGQPATMQDDTAYEDLFGEILSYLEQSLHLAYDAGIDLRRTLVDPGIGFGKRLTQNLDLVAGMHRLWALGRPSLLGPSRKRFLGEITGRPVDAREYATAAAITAGVLAGTRVVRVHDSIMGSDAVAVATALRGRPPFTTH